jgi:hypothetical protein
MFVPTLYVCYQVEQSRRQDERRDAQLWRMLRQEHSSDRPRRALRKRRAIRASWVRSLLGSPGL